MRICLDFKTVTLPTADRIATPPPTSLLCLSTRQLTIAIASSGGRTLTARQILGICLIGAVTPVDVIEALQHFSLIMSRNSTPEEKPTSKRLATVGLEPATCRVHLH